MNLKNNNDTLELRDITVYEKGIYECEAENDYHKIYSVYELNFVGMVFITVIFQRFNFFLIVSCIKTTLLNGGKCFITQTKVHLFKRNFLGSTFLNNLYTIMIHFPTHMILLSQIEKIFSFVL